MKIATYNVNGVNGRLPVLLRWLEESAARRRLPAGAEGAATRSFPKGRSATLGYDAIWHGQKSWNGVAILSRVGAIQRDAARPARRSRRHAQPLHRGGGRRRPDRRPLPAQRQPPARPEVRLQAALVRPADRPCRRACWQSGMPVVLAGDFNVMPTDLDVYKPERWLDDALFAPEARAAYFRLLEQGWTDALRTLHPDERIYTFWDYFRNAYARNAGLRIDHLLLSPSLAAAAGATRRSTRTSAAGRRRATTRPFGSN